MKMFKNQVLWCCIILTNLIGFIYNEEDILPPPCHSDIYCHGRLLDTIQSSKIYEDSKTFVDMKLKYPPNITLQKFDKFMERFNNTPSRGDVIDFVSEHFEPEGQEFEHWDPDDWVEHPGFVNSIVDEEFYQWALKLNEIWKILGRKMKAEVEHHQNLYSIIWVPHPVIVPGGRFREFYYWDSYWILQGLLLSEMNHTVKGILENFLYIVKTYGHIPNGGRIYYLARSQPPLLTPMMKIYLEFTNDVQFIKDNLPMLEREFEFWMKNHTINVEKDGKNYTLAIYGDKSHGPRPESYSEDVDIAKQMWKDQPKREAFYSELKAAAESGWDFSSRWFIKNATNKGNLTDIKTRSIVPVDLNSMIYWNAVILAEFNDMVHNVNKSKYYNAIAQRWLEGVTAVLWHEEVGAWLDYDLYNSVKRDYFYPTNIAPLWTGCYNQTDKESIVRLVLKYLQVKGIMDYQGGIPTTKEHTGEQWDYPNAWPPLQHMMVVGLNNTGDANAQRLAFEIAEKWVRSNYKAFKETDAMYEKYDATVLGGHGGGGEYELQLGFGWTNGIIMDLLYRYPRTLRAEDLPIVPEESLQTASITASTSSSYNSPLSTALIALLVSLTAGFIG